MWQLKLGWILMMKRKMMKRKIRLKTFETSEEGFFKFELYTQRDYYFFHNLKDRNLRNIFSHLHTKRCFFSFSDILNFLLWNKTVWNFFAEGNFLSLKKAKEKVIFHLKTTNKRMWRLMPGGKQLRRWVSVRVYLHVYV